ncbi:MAG: AhpC/TSA family protein [Proteobacteria bacterium]|nr:AhpC/TSA family protein [Pseudomonadota bacterium]
MSLKNDIDEFKSTFLPQIPGQLRNTMDKAQQALKDSRIAERALAAGNDAVDFTLPNARGEQVSSEALRQQGPIVVSFYRGGWCPYCSLELKALQSVNAEIEALGARLVAISPQVPDESLSTAEKNRLEFEVLSDVDSKVADQYGLTFSLDEDLRPVYKNWGADVAVVNDDPDCKLPLPATYVISQDGKIVHSFVEEDYTERLEPDEILDSLRNLRRD